jgi:hypothetical protein
MSEVKVGFGLTGIKIGQFATFAENYNANKPSDLITDLGFALTQEKRVVSPIVTFTFQQGKKAFIKLEVICHFEIIQDAWESFIGEDKIIIPQNVLEHTAMLTIGAARGILFTKTEGTVFQQFLLPTINVTKMVKGDGLFELQK